MGLLINSKTATIANGAALSGAVALGGQVPCAIQMSAAWVAAALTFQASDDNGATWRELLDNAGVAITLTAPAAGNRYNLFATDFQSALFIKVRSGTLAVPVNQGAGCTLAIITRKFYPVR